MISKDFKKWLQKRGYENTHMDMETIHKLYQQFLQSDINNN